MPRVTLRILAISEDSPFLAGGRLVFFRLCRALSESGHDVIVLTGQGATQRILKPTSIERRIPATSRRVIGPILLGIRLLFSAIHEVGNRNLVFVNAGVMVPLGALLKFLTHRIVVELHHDVLTPGELVSLATGPTRKLTAIVRWILNYLPLTYYDLALCVSSYTADRLNALLRNKPKLRFVIGNPVVIEYT